MNMLPKSFSWSYSALKNFETCEHRYAEVDLRRSIEEVKSIELKRGDALHLAMFKRVGSSIPLPPEFIYMEPWAEKLTRVLHPLQITQCELKLAIDSQGTPVGYFDKNVWLRVRIDYLRILPTSKGFDIGQVIDYKTSKIKEDYTQLMLNAHAIFCHYKHIRDLRTEFIWTEYNSISHEDFTRERVQKDMKELLPRVHRLETARKTSNFRPKPGGLCYEYCPVSTCEFYGKRHKRTALPA